MMMIYREANTEDSPQLAEFGGRVFLASYAHVMDEELQSYARASFTTAQQRAELADPSITTFLALDREIIGYAQLRIDSRPDCALTAAAPAELKRIYVDHGWHGRGVAQELLTLIHDVALQRGCDVLWLAVWEINARAISFYSKNGFRQIGRQGFPIGNEVQSDLVMARPLADELH
jgi:diamine N-acetyltransferase